MGKTRVTIRFETATIDAIDAVADEFSITRSRIIRDLVGNQLDEEALSEAVRDAIPEATRKLAAREAQEQRMMDRQKLREKRASFNDRVRGYFSKRLEGHEAYDPDDMDELAEGYKEDAQIWFDDPEDIEAKEQLVDKWFDWYEMGYWARQHSDTVETEVNSDDVSGGWFEVGEHLYRLREHLDEVTSEIMRIANTQNVGMDSDAVVDALCRRYTVCDGAVLLVLEHMVDDPDGSISDSLIRGGDAISLPSGLGGDRQLTNGSGANGELTNGHDDVDGEIVVEHNQTEPDSGGYSDGCVPSGARIDLDDVEGLDQEDLAAMDEQEIVSLISELSQDDDDDPDDGYDDWVVEQ